MLIEGKQIDYEVLYLSGGHIRWHLGSDFDAVAKRNLICEIDRPYKTS